MRFKNFDLPWFKLKIGDIYDVQMCRRIFAIQTKEIGDVPFYKIGTLGGKADAYISNELFKEYKQKYNYPIKGETLITCSGTIGRCVQFDGKPSYYQDSNIVWLRKRKNLITNDFLFRLIQINDWSKLNTTTISRLYNADLLGLKFYVPSFVQEQEKISTFLALLDSRIETQNKIIDKLESLKKQINNAFFSSLQKQVLFKTIYKSAREGGTPDTNTTSYYLNGTIPFVKIDDLYSKHIIKAKSFINESGLKNSSAWIIPPNSILLSNGATIGETSLNQIPVATKQGILGIVPTSEYNSEFLYYLFKSDNFKRGLKRITTKGTMDAAYLKDIDKLSIPSCDIKSQNEYVERINKIEDKLFNEIKKLNLYKIQKKCLLANLFI